MKAKTQTISSYQKFKDYEFKDLLTLLEDIRKSNSLVRSWVQEDNLREHKYRVNKFRKEACNKNLFFSDFRCPVCGKRKVKKHICSSFFCEECGEKYEERQKTRHKLLLYKGAEYLHLTFTIPKSFRNKVKWNKWLLFEGEAKRSIHYFFDVVRETLKETFEDYEIGAIASLHSYGSLDYKWKPHIDVLLCKRGFEERDYYKQPHIINLGYFDFDKLRERYKKKLESVFKSEINKRVVVQIAEDKEGNIKSLDMSDCLNEIGYFRKIPIKNNHILEVTPTKVKFTTPKRRAFDKEPIVLSHPKFFKRVVQHIPSINITQKGRNQSMRLLRRWGFFSPHHHLHNYYPKHKEVEIKKEVMCEECGVPMKLFFTSAGTVVYVNKELKSDILDSKDFNSKQNLQFQALKKLEEGKKPPSELIPKENPPWSITKSQKSKKPLEETIKVTLKQGGGHLTKSYLVSSVHKKGFPKSKIKTFLEKMKKDGKIFQLKGEVHLTK